MLPLNLFIGIYVMHLIRGGSCVYYKTCSLQKFGFLIAILILVGSYLFFQWFGDTSPALSTLKLNALPLNIWADHHPRWNYAFFCRWSIVKRRISLSILLYRKLFIHIQQLFRYFCSWKRILISCKQCIINYDSLFQSESLHLRLPTCSQWRIADPQQQVSIHAMLYG